MPLSMSTFIVTNCKKVATCLLCQCWISSDSFLGDNVTWYTEFFMKALICLHPESCQFYRFDLYLKVIKLSLSLFLQMVFYSKKLIGFCDQMDILSIQHPLPIEKIKNTQWYGRNWWIWLQQCAGSSLPERFRLQSGSNRKIRHASSSMQRIRLWKYVMLWMIFNHHGKYL